MKTYNNINIIDSYITKLGESPYWDNTYNALIYVDMLGKKLLSYNPYTQETKVWDMPDIIGCVNPIDSNNCIVGLNTGIFEFNMLSQKFKCLWNRTDYTNPSVRFNDGKCDSLGRLWIGTTDVLRNKICGFYKFDQELIQYTKDLIVSNGLVWSLDNKTLYHIDTWTQSIFSYDYDLENATISNQKIAFTFPKEYTNPDGMTIDNEGMLWIALFGNSCVGRFNPHTGELLSKIILPVKYPTTCVFGGKDMYTLYIPSAISDDPSPLAGKLFSVDLEYYGFKANNYQVESKGIIL